MRYRGVAKVVHVVPVSIVQQVRLHGLSKYKPSLEVQGGAMRPERNQVTEFSTRIYNPGNSRRL
jgi:hypothetical protein